MVFDTYHAAKAAIKNIQPCKLSSGDLAYTGTKRRSAAKPPPGNFSHDQGDGFDPNMPTFTYSAVLANSHGGACAHRPSGRVLLTGALGYRCAG